MNEIASETLSQCAFLQITAVSCPGQQDRHIRDRVADEADPGARSHATGIIPRRL